MSWDYKTRPPFAPDAEPTDRGWEAPLKGTDPADGLKELIVAIGGLPLKAGAATIKEVSFVQDELKIGLPLSVRVRFSERVDVEAGASIEVSSTGDTDPIVLHALAQEDALEVLFDQVVSLDDPVLVPSDDAPFELSIAAQTMSGDIKDADAEAEDAVLDISAAIASAAGTREITVPQILSVSFGAEELEMEDELSVTVVFDRPVDVSAGAMLEVARSDDDPIEVYALAQSGTEIVFDQVDTLDAPALVPAALAAYTISIEEQEITGTAVEPDAPLSEASLDISEDVALAAGTVEVELP